MSSSISAHRLVVLLLLAALMVALQPGEANACSCVPTVTADVVADAELVFVGEEIGRTEIRDAWPPVAVNFRVVEAYKGEVPEDVTLWTGHGGGDCGVGPLSGLVGISAYQESGRWSINICGSVHDPAAIAAILEPIGVAGSTDPGESPPGAGGAGLWLGAAAFGGILSAAGIVWIRRRRRDWYDGWNGAG